MLPPDPGFTLIAELLAVDTLYPLPLTVFGTTKEYNASELPLSIFSTPSLDVAIDSEVLVPRTTRLILYENAILKAGPVQMVDTNSSLQFIGDPYNPATRVLDLNGYTTVMNEGRVVIAEGAQIVLSCMTLKNVQTVLGEISIGMKLSFNIAVEAKKLLEVAFAKSKLSSPRASGSRRALRQSEPVAINFDTFVWFGITGENVTFLADPSDPQPDNRYTGKEGTRPKGVLEGHTSAVNCLSINTHGGILVSGSDDETLRLWSVNSARPGPVLEGHSGGITNVAWGDSAGELLASASRDHSVRIWRLGPRNSWFCSTTLLCHGSPVIKISFSCDGKQEVPAGGGVGPLREVVQQQLQQKQQKQQKGTRQHRATALGNCTFASWLGPALFGAATAESFQIYHSIKSLSPQTSPPESVPSIPGPPKASPRTSSAAMSAPARSPRPTSAPPIRQPGTKSVFKGFGSGTTKGQGLLDSSLAAECFYSTPAAIVEASLCLAKLDKDEQGPSGDLTRKLLSIGDTEVEASLCLAKLDKDEQGPSGDLTRKLLSIGDTEVKAAVTDTEGSQPCWRRRVVVISDLLHLLARTSPFLIAAHPIASLL
eukprot:gene22600-29741_t